MVICFRLKSYDDPSQSPDFVLQLSNVQIIPTNVLYHQDHLLNIIQLNIKQIVEFIKWAFNIFFIIFLNLILFCFVVKCTEYKLFVMRT